MLCWIFFFAALLARARANLSAAQKLPETTEAEKLCKALAVFRATNATQLGASTFSLALFTAAEQHVRDLGMMEPASGCSLWSWSTRSELIFSACCVPLESRYNNVCSKEKPTEITRNWLEIYPGDGVEHVVRLDSPTPPLAATIARIQTEFRDQLLGNGSFASYLALGCAVAPPFVSVWLGSVPDPIPYKTGGAPPLSPPETPAPSLVDPIQDNLTIIIGASVGGVGVCALCCALLFYFYQRKPKPVDIRGVELNGKKLQEAGGQYGSLNGIKGAHDPDNQIYAPPSSDSGSIYAPDKIFVNPDAGTGPLLRRDTMMSARSDTVLETSQFGSYAAMPPAQSAAMLMQQQQQMMFNQQQQELMRQSQLLQQQQQQLLMSQRASQAVVPVPDTVYEW